MSSGCEPGVLSMVRPAAHVAILRMFFGDAPAGGFQITSASALLAKFKERVGNTQPAQMADEAWQVSDKYLGRMCVFRKGKYLAGFSNLPAEIDPVPLAQKLASKIQ